MKPLFSLYSFLREKNKLQCLNNFSVPIDATIKKKLQSKKQFLIN